MGRLRWAGYVFLVCLPVAVLAAGYDLPGLRGRKPTAVPAAVPAGDQEIVWLHTTTNAMTWERFVAGVRRGAAEIPGVTVDDSEAFQDQTTTVPEVVISYAGRAGKLRVRWYKLTSYAKPSQWVRALTHRDPPPLAIIGGGSSDRARDLAAALARTENWKGDKPLLLLTTATAERVHAESDDPAEGDGGAKELLKIYDGRTFRFGFGNRQMAEAMLDFVWHRPDLRPQLLTLPAVAAVASGLSARPHKPSVLYVDWNDDPYSGDLLEQFQDALPRVAGGANFFRWQVPFSVGGFYQPNRAEAEAADSILQELAKIPDERALLVLPTVPSPARRLLRKLCDASPGLGKRVVVLNGDGITANTVLRDGAFAWPVQALPVPLVLFTHNDPLAWDGGDLVGPNSTEDVLHFAHLTRILTAAAFAPEAVVARADDLATNLRATAPPFFDAGGSRKDGSGEFILLLNPAPTGPVLEVWTRTPAGWTLHRTQPVQRAGGVK